MRAFKSLASLSFVIAAALATSCSKSSEEGSGKGGAGKANRLDWEKVSSDWNPSIDNYEVEMRGAPKLKVALFGSDMDVSLNYVSDLRPNTARVKVYKVWKKQASWGSVDINLRGDSLEVTNSGTYACSINIKNGVIQDLEGGCYVRVDISLPTDSQVEVYNAGKLISRRFIAMSNAELISGVDRAPWKDDKFAVINAYIASYYDVGRAPELSVMELGTLVKEFSFKEEKYEVLRKLNRFVYARSGMAQMIDDSFSYFDREEARRICGL